MAPPTTQLYIDSLLEVLTVCPRAAPGTWRALDKRLSDEFLLPPPEELRVALKSRGGFVLAGLVIPESGLHGVRHVRPWSIPGALWVPGPQRRRHPLWCGLQFRR